ncbi:MAG: hypothetical protein AABZ02_07210 [Bacteroidota bacterium]|jgi:hypothetical protein
MKRASNLVVLLAVASLLAVAQDLPLRDSSIVFNPSSPDLIQKTTYEPFRNAWGVDLLLSNNGFGAGAFYRREFSDVLSGFVQFAISDVKDEGEVEYFNQFTGESFVPGKKNRLLLFPLTFGVQYRLFKDDIVDNFRPYVGAGVGPSMVFVAPYSTARTIPLPDGGTMTYYEQVEFFSSLKHGQAKYTLGGYIGAGAYFGFDKGTLSGVSIRYYFIPFQHGIESLENVFIKRFGGFFITLNFGSLY